MNIKEIDGVKYVTLAEHNDMLLTAIRLEREACASILVVKTLSIGPGMVRETLKECAASIRARGQSCPPCNDDCNQGRNCQARG